MIPAACLDNGLCPVGLVEAVGIELSLQGDAGVFTVVDTLLAAVLQKVSGVELPGQSV